ncbi:polyprenyl synthetase family protein [Pseudonocardia sp. HH130630-07]|uniref:polyprenyl synthetase family protein n=1 Tax=Pseudonocardia sp. HH130630-07 TaxID=1690815 RepID=UPI0008152754|nr:polyprenyl synthetase family protein [Pseudonocardia sp. HH130630-07]ANY07339.1 hypothetical protein AFB00_14765 [Pseudonocardia sp. HH130630-07]
MTATARPTGLDAPELAAARTRSFEALRDAVQRLCPAVAHVAGYHAGWTDERGRPLERSSGKALRPALALLAARAAGAGEEHGIAAGVAVELVHDFSLLHDDVMDGDTERRHRPAAWTVFGTPTAILTGDALLAAAVEVLTEAEGPGRAEAIRLLLGTVRRLIAGQERDVAFETRHSVTVEEYLAMAAGKTAALITAAVTVGPLLAGAPRPVLDDLEGYGRHLGLAFQITDDLLGTWGAPEITGKPVLGDIRRRKMTLPVVVAMAGSGPDAQWLREVYRGGDVLSDEEAARVADVVERSGGRAAAETRARHHVTSACRYAERLGPGDGAVRHLVGLATAVADRSS